MSQRVSYEQYLNMLSERSIDTTRQLRRNINQRRNGMEDLYGVCFTANGDANHPATFYISLSPDYVYLQRFAFKFVIKPYTSSVAGATTSIDSVTESIYVMEGTSTLTEEMSGQGATTELDYGIKTFNTTSVEWRVLIDDIDITAYLIEQQGGAWIGGQGIFPNNRLEDVEDFYDILDVASVLTAEGKVSERERLLSPTFKKVQIASDQKFGVDAYLYLKYANTNR